MVSNKVLRLWARMVRNLPIRTIAPQHGAPMAGAAVGQFIEWASGLECGIDLITQADYALP
jgi:flavorubredoxin